MPVGRLSGNRDGQRISVQVTVVTDHAIGGYTQSVVFLNIVRVVCGNGRVVFTGYRNGDGG